MDIKQPDWEISQLYSRAWEIIKKHKILWIFGLAASGWGANYNSQGDFDPKSFEKLFQNTNPPPTPETFNNVLGAATSSPFLESVKNIFNGIPLYFYLLLGLEFLILTLIGLVINLAYSAWSQGLLLKGAFDASEDRTVSIETVSAAVIPKIKPLLWLQIIPGLIFALASVLVFGILAIATALLPNPAKAIPIILTVVAVGAFIYWLIQLTLAQIWAPRKVLAEDLAGKEAFFSGLEVARKKFWASLLLGIVNNILAFFVVMVPSLILVAILGAGVFGAIASMDARVILAILGLSLLAVVIIGFSILSGALNAFKAVVWTLAYKQIKEKYG